MTTLLAALVLLTRLPVRRGAASAAAGDGSMGAGVGAERTGAAAFAIAGALVGAGALAAVLLVGSSEPVLGAVLAVAVMTLLTGALHLDGLADTADALLAGDPRRGEVARKDPAVGPGGVAALILVLGVEIAALASLVESSGALIAGVAAVGAGAVSRTMPVVLARLLRVRATGEGFGSWFAMRVASADLAIAVTSAAVLVAALAVLVDSSAVFIGAVGGALAGLAGSLAVTRARGRLDGDGMGSAVELTMGATLFGIALVAA